MTMQPANVSVDPLESLNVPHEDVADTSALPFPEESVLAETPPQEATPPEPTTPVDPPAFNWDSDENPFKAKLTEVTSTLNQYQPFFAKLAEAETAQKAAAIEAIAKKVDQASEESAAPLSNDERVAVRTAITGYLQYREQEPVVVQERLVGTAIKYAGDLLGDNATVGDLKKTASQLLSKYNNAQGMEAYVAAALEYKQTQTEARRAETAAQRVTTGVDSVVSAPPQSGSMSNLNDYERAIYKGVTLTDKQWANYQALRRQRGLD